MVFVPEFDFMNLNFASLVAPQEKCFEYTGRSQLVQHVTGATAAQGNILPIVPSIHCNYPSEFERTAILDDYRSYTQNTEEPSLSYLT
ncbi:hypothetical protein OCU04_011985 [Sclerotinia nivalis]|uniref:Uncharacterized protein n=1 Tax=Sclerotinia nivalis TaxID=352851 RepID=A0A9X0AB79_9HELO|nr:hypothetical protein OCU04_011985 [Sclerotinia nivalis]